MSVNQSHHLLFVKDIDEQILFMTETKSRKIRSFFY